MKDELKPVDQTVLGTGNPRANCFQACLAMLSGLPLDQCIDITDPDIDEGHWVKHVERWAEQNGFRFVAGIKAPTDRPYIANGPTDERDGAHAVVCVGSELFHDPHPSRDGVTRANWYGWLEAAQQGEADNARIVSLLEEIAVLRNSACKNCGFMPENTD